jgi:hypothetical protein
MIEKFCLNRHIPAGPDFPPAPRLGPLEPLHETVRAREAEMANPVRVNFMNAECEPGRLSQVPVIAAEQVADPVGNAGWAVEIERPGRGVVMADKGGNSHDVVHVGMGDENRIDRFDDALGKMRYLAAIKEQGAL